MKADNPRCKKDSFNDWPLLMSAKGDMMEKRGKRKSYFHEEYFFRIYAYILFLS